MQKYRAKAPSIVEPAQTQVFELPSFAKTSTRFGLDDHPIYVETHSTASTWSVEDEFAKYTSCPLTRPSCSILTYWEVRKYFCLNLNISLQFTTHATDRPISLSFLLSFLSPWTTFRSRRLLSHVNVSSHPLGRPIQRNEIGSVWR